MRAPTVGIVDYGRGNLFSVEQACRTVGLVPVVTSDAHELERADGVVLPGVGAFGDAVEALRRLDLLQPLRDLAEAGRPLLGVCLGMQLLMDHSEEFGSHEGLGLIPGRVVRLPAESVDGVDGPRPLKVPQIGWNRVRRSVTDATGDPWEAGPLAGLPDGTHMYFIHSYYVVPDDDDVVLATSRYGQTEYCSAVRRGQVFGCQFHPERSAAAGLAVYRNFRSTMTDDDRT